VFPIQRLQEFFFLFLILGEDWRNVVESRGKKWHVSKLRGGLASFEPEHFLTAKRQRQALAFSFAFVCLPTSANRDVLYCFPRFKP